MEQKGWAKLALIKTQPNLQKRQQVVAKIVDEIAAHRLDPDTVLTHTTELAQKFGIGKKTINQWLTDETSPEDLSYRTQILNRQHQKEMVNLSLESRPPPKQKAPGPGRSAPRRWTNFEIRKALNVDLAQSLGLTPAKDWEEWYRVTQR